MQKHISTWQLLYSTFCSSELMYNIIAIIPFAILLCTLPKFHRAPVLKLKVHSPFKDGFNQNEYHQCYGIARLLTNCIRNQMILYKICKFHSYKKNWRTFASLPIVKFGLLWGLLIRNLDGFGNGQKPRKWYHRYFNFVAFMAYIKKIGPDIVGIFCCLSTKQCIAKRFYISWESKGLFRWYHNSINYGSLIH